MLADAQLSADEACPLQVLAADVDGDHLGRPARQRDRAAPLQAAQFQHPLRALQTFQEVANEGLVFFDFEMSAQILAGHTEPGRPGAQRFESLRQLMATENVVH